MYAPQGVGVRSALAVHFPGMKNRRGGVLFFIYWKLQTLADTWVHCAGWGGGVCVVWWGCWFKGVEVGVDW